MKEPLTHAELLERATFRRRKSPFGVGAAFDRDCTRPDRDEARHWRFLITDTMTGFAYVEFVATRIGYGTSLLVEPLEDAVEELSGSYPHECRLLAMAIDCQPRQEPRRLLLGDQHRVPAPTAA